MMNAGRFRLVWKWTQEKTFSTETVFLFPTSQICLGKSFSRKCSVGRRADRQRHSASCKAKEAEPRPGGVRPRQEEEVKVLRVGVDAVVGSVRR